MKIISFKLNGPSKNIHQKVYRDFPGGENQGFCQSYFTFILALYPCLLVANRRRKKIMFFGGSNLGRGTVPNVFKGKRRRLLAKMFLDLYTGWDESGQVVPERCS